MTVMVDRFEPDQIYNLIGQSVDVNVVGLNNQGLADYVWFAHDGHRIQIERKQTPELLASLDSVEEQLQRHLRNGVEETILLIEGVCEPVLGLKTAIQTWRKAKDKAILVPGRVFNCSYTGYKAWQNQLDKAGVTVVETFDYTATAMTIVALYQNSLKAEHTTLTRYIKDRIYSEEKNPHVLNLMSIKGGGIGEERAKALIARYATYWFTINQHPEDLADTMVGNKRLGLPAAKKLLRAIGRTA